MRRRVIMVGSFLWDALDHALAQSPKIVCFSLYSINFIPFLYFQYSRIASQMEAKTHCLKKVRCSGFERTKLT